MSNPPNFSEVQELGPYKVIHLLGTNDILATFKGHHEHQGLNAQVVCLHESQLKDPDAWVRFMDEMDGLLRLTANRLCHPYASGNQEGFLWAAYEWQNGSHIGARVRDKGLPETWDAFQWIGETAQAIATHQASCGAHGALSPASIFINDFPQAKLLHGAWGRLFYSIEGGIKNPQLTSILPFTAPENLDVSVPDIQSDVYSLGANLYYLISGEPPEWSDDPAELIRRVSSPNLDLTKIAEYVDEPCLEVLEEMLSPDPDERPLNLPALSDRLIALGNSLFERSQQQGAGQGSPAVTAPAINTEQSQATPVPQKEAPKPEAPPVTQPTVQEPAVQPPPLDSTGKKIGDVVSQRQSELEIKKPDDLPPPPAQEQAPQEEQASATSSAPKKSMLPVILLVTFVGLFIVIGGAGAAIFFFFSTGEDDNSSTSIVEKDQPAPTTSSSSTENSSSGSDMIAEYDLAAEKLRILGQLSKGFHRTNGRWPRKLAELETMGAKTEDMVDPWGKEVDVRLEFVVSSGKDKTWDTQDDIWYDADKALPGGYDYTP